MNTNFTIQGLRGLCALIVFICHLVGMAGVAGFLHFNEFWEIKNEVIAATGVNLFFVISGYLISHSLMKHKLIKKFLWNRVLRIYPVYLLLFVIMFTIGPIIDFEWFKDIRSLDYFKNLFGNLFMLQGIFPIPQAVQNSWSLGYEFAFYINACLIFIILQGDFVKNRYIRGFCLILTILISLTILFYRPRAMFFLVGVFLYFIQRKNKENAKSNVYSSYNLLLKTRGIIFLCLTIISFEYSTFISVVFSFFFFVDIIKEKGILASVLRSRVFQYFGSISYSLYLWHPFGIFPLKILLPKVIPNNNLTTFVIFALFGTIFSLLLSHYSYKYIEVWFTNQMRIKKLYTKMTKNHSTNQAS
ncbi:acyltransferase family protein [Peribacillus sp. NPDC096622]|uniref:acyltransferase family protein n=1 Tax=Peribacillus sp. NPDC096622 TaxID=3364396 RepID=UPI0037F2A8D8